MIDIEPVPKRYAWGSLTALQRLIGASAGTVPDPTGPLAELWFSGHADSPSMLRMPQQGAALTARAVGLDAAIRAQPTAMVGEAASCAFGPVLPYLFKVIAARIPLSLQVHPIDFEARAGYNREREAGIAPDAPERSFKDTLAKHEMVTALGPFDASVGFMPPRKAAVALGAVDHPLARRMLAVLRGDASDVALADAQLARAMMPPGALAWPQSSKRLFCAFHVAVTASGKSEDCAAAPSCAGALRRALAVAGPDAVQGRARRAIAHALAAATAFPTDPSVMALLLLNPVHLEDGGSVFIPAGVPHAYLHGVAAEIMTNSDNVLRAGMTPKHRDIPSLLRSLDCRAGMPRDPLARRRALPDASDGDLRIYRPPLSEYMLTYGRASGVASWAQVDGLPQRGPRVLLCLSGQIDAVTSCDRRTLGRGEAVFVPDAEGWLRIDATDAGGSGTGGGTAFLLASTPA